MRHETLQWMMENRVRSFGPETGLVLIAVFRSLTQALADDPPLDDDVLHEVEMYIVALDRVMNAGQMYQCAVIEKLGELVEGGGER